MSKFCMDMDVAVPGCSYLALHRNLMVCAVNGF